MDKWREREKEAKKRTRDVAGVVITLGLSLMSAFLFSKALWAAICLVPTFAFGFDLLGTFIPSSQRFRRSMILAEIFLSIACVYGLWQTVLRDQYRSQRAAETEGDLEPLPPDGTDGVTLQIGSDGPQYVRTVSGNIARIIMPLEALNLGYDSGLEIVKGANGVELTTPVIDREGNRVGEIVANHWKVYPPYCSDKNYNKHSIEMKDKAGHVVLQVTLYRNKIQLQGEWHTSLGQGERLAAVQGWSNTTFWLKPEDENKFPFLIKPMFAYPSSQHWGELVSKPQGIPGH